MSLMNCPECNREVSSQAGNCPHCGYPLHTPSKSDATARQPNKKMGCLGYIGSALLIFIGALVIFIAITAIGSLIKSPNTKSTSSSPPAVTESDKKAKAKLTMEDEKRFEECRKKLKMAEKLEVLYDLEWKQAMPTVVVGPTFYSIPIDAKQGFADTVNCFLMTGKSNYIDFDLLDWQTGKRVAQYSMGSLKMD